MSPAWLPNTFSGLMVGDYVSTAFSGGKAFAIFAAAQANAGTVFDEPVYSTTTGFSNAQQVATFRSRRSLRPSPPSVLRPGTPLRHQPTRQLGRQYCERSAEQLDVVTLGEG